MRESRATSNLATDAYRVMRRRLARGELRLGQTVSRRQLAAELGMSFLPVSFALLRLEYEGFLESRPRAGTRVRIPSREELCGHYVVREALEVQSAKLFTTHASAKAREELKRLAAEVDDLAVQLDRVRYSQAHQKFHRRIAEGAGCPALSAALEQTHALASIWFCGMGQQRRTQPPSRHKELAEILIADDPSVSEEAMRKHVASGLEHALEALKPYLSKGRTHDEPFIRRRSSTM